MSVATTISALFDDDDPRSKLIVEVTDQEQDSLRKADKRRISQSTVLDTPNTTGLRRAITTFVVAVGVRQWQQREAGCGQPNTPWSSTTISSGRRTPGRIR